LFLSAKLSVDALIIDGSNNSDLRSPSISPEPVKIVTAEEIAI
jgi:hypothetical protein